MAVLYQWDCLLERNGGSFPSNFSDGAQQHLLGATSQQKECHNQRVHDTPRTVDEVVYIRDHGMKGRHKIQDLWSSVVYQVVKALVGEGAAYTVAPVDDLHQFRVRVWDLLEDDSFGGSEVFLLVPESTLSTVSQALCSIGPSMTVPLGARCILGPEPTSPIQLVPSVFLLCAVLLV